MKDEIEGDDITGEVNGRERVIISKFAETNNTLGQSIWSAGNAMKDEIEGDDITGEVNGRERVLEKGSYKRRKI